MLAVSLLLTDPAVHNWKIWLEKEEVTTDSFERNVFYREDTTVLKRDTASLGLSKGARRSKYITQRAISFHRSKKLDFIQTAYLGRLIGNPEKTWHPP